MTKLLNFDLKIKGEIGRVAHRKSSNPATPQKKFETCTYSVKVCNGYVTECRGSLSNQNFIDLIQIISVFVTFTY